MQPTLCSTVSAVNKRVATLPKMEHYVVLLCEATKRTSGTHHLNCLSTYHLFKAWNKTSP